MDIKIQTATTSVQGYETWDWTQNSVLFSKHGSEITESLTLIAWFNFLNVPRCCTKTIVFGRNLLFLETKEIKILSLEPGYATQVL